MKIILLSGGSGKRLWPLSNEVRSKAFLNLLPAAGGGKESMIQRVCRQLSDAGLLSSTLIVTHSSQLEIMQSQIGSLVPILTEPHKRGTFTAIALATAYLHEQEPFTDEVLCFLPVDPFVENEFFERLPALPAILKQSASDLALLGTRPYFASTQYGYIVPRLTDTSASSYLPVARFSEKPDLETAQQLIAQKAFWNCGVFAFHRSFMLDAMRKRGLPIPYEDLIRLYDKLPEASFDEEIAEKTRHSVVVPYDGMWEDLGSWGALTTHLANSANGPGSVSDDSVNTHLVNELQIPVHIIEVPDIIVAANAEGILVASKQSSSRIKELKPNEGLPPMYEEKSWGSYRVLDLHPRQQEGELTEGTVTRKVRLEAGKHMPYQKHARRKEVWTLLSGSGEFVLNGKIIPVQAGDVLLIAPGAGCAIKAEQPIELIQVLIGTDLDQEEVPTFPATWEEVVRACRNGQDSD
ncbi:sugar phosphate nucleotidyltransferase [Paenibacillus lutrae]|uniref:NTP transferase domain-containing protein n=1 Tax=Paenibacillus lutrae TaxID=2078573 RepID=A0A7X3K0G6_9BACL|nr:sugar phosphate nucleotidyltransferase [Paenibacillus lutrae]MVP01148.1 NTP transferase domain-containing protein [Paenibacillus lutrae]